MSLLTIAFATTERSVSGVVDAIRGKSSDRQLTYLVVCQVSKQEDAALDVLTRLRGERRDVDFVVRREKGVSRSRNAALTNCRSTFIWFLDDDVEIDDRAVRNNLLPRLERSGADVLLCMIRSTENPDVYYKDYSFRRRKEKVRRIELLKASSIEIICRVRFSEGKGIKFNEEFGLGTELPCCEENLFLLDLYDAGASMQYFNETLVFHPISRENRLDETRNHLIARGLLLRRFAVIFRILLMIRWSLRNGAFSSKFLVRFATLIEGFRAGK